ncbi:hypothetical protein VTH82DRAFT_7464 [Thermothelomyces myriococcoides]
MGLEDYKALDKHYDCYKILREIQGVLPTALTPLW